MIYASFKTVKAGFFDRAKVQRSVDVAERRVLSRFGAFVRQRAKTSIRQRKAVSLVGSTPSSHTGILKRFIFFSYSRERKSVVIGPTQLNRGDGKTPRLLESGGKRRVGFKTRTYRPRPYMGPAFAKELEGMPSLWRNAVKA